MAIVIRLICLVGTLSLGACNCCQPEPPLLTRVMYSADASTIRAVQIALRRRQYYTGATDGFLGYATGNAIQRFQMDHCLRVKAVIDRPLLIALGLASK
jgi:peptidoglycan hydrolase-like protein with peptidoglycan-binding domain